MKQVYLIALLLLLGGCVETGMDFKKIDLDARFDAQSDQRIAVEVRDRRPYVVNGERQPDFIGGIPLKYDQVQFDSEFKTSDRRPLAENLAELVTSSLVDQGLQAAPLNENEVYDILLRFTVKEWTVNKIGRGLGYYYDVDLSVLDERETIQSQRNVSDICVYPFAQIFSLTQAGIDPWIGTSENVLEALLSDAGAGSVCQELLMKPVPGNRLAAEVPPGKARVIFVLPPHRTNSPFPSVAPILEIGSGKGDMVGFLSAGSKVSYLTEPGEKLFMVIGENTDVMRAYLDENKTYYVKLKHHIGWVRDHYQLEPVTLARAPYSGASESILVENTETSRSWVQNNQESVATKIDSALQKWNRKSEAEKSAHTLSADDAR